MWFVSGAVVIPQIEYGDSTGALRAAYDEMQATLRVPWVMFAARSLAVFGGFVPAAWSAARPTFGSSRIEEAADELRRLAVLPGAEPPKLRALLAERGVDADTIDSAGRAVEVLNYGNAKYLLLITAWCEAIQGREAGGGPNADPSPLTPLAVGVPPDMPALHLVDPAAVDATVAGLLRRTAHLHFHHGPASDFRVLAAWPPVLEAVCDQILAPVVRTRDYELTALGLLDAARATVRTLPQPAGLTPTQASQVCTEAEIAAITGVLFMFQRFILDVTIDLLRVGHAFGEATSGRSRYSL